METFWSSDEHGGLMVRDKYLCRRFESQYKQKLYVTSRWQTERENNDIQIRKDIPNISNTIVF